MDRLALLKELSFGARVAEDETAELAGYFVETDQWTRIARGEIDVVRGEKGAGKSAIYSLLMAKEDEFFDRRILLVAGEKPRGTPVFKDLVADPPTSEAEFIGLWKLYILTLIARRMREFDIKGVAAERVYSALAEAHLLEKDFNLGSLLRSVQEYARRWFNPASVEGQFSMDASTGMPLVSAKITPREPGAELRAKGFMSIDSLIGDADAALSAAGFEIWVLLDRLDVAFAETHDLEQNALRALFRVYRDVSGYDQITLKIFLRSDIWRRITESGFREASHITSVAVLEWNSASLLNLLVRRLLKNKALVAELKIDRDATLRDFKAQNELFYRLFPRQVEQGTRKPSTFDWMTSRCADGTGNTAPREMIHLLTSLREQEIARLERGEPSPDGDQLFDRTVFKMALPSVSEARLVQNLYAEYPDLKPYLEHLSGEKTEQTIDSLATIWHLPRSQTLATVQQAIDVGFFQPRGSREEATFWVPFLYRDALKMSQGLADETDAELPL
jgi:hypothetical protein